MELTVRVADTLLDLLVVGHAKYSKFRRKYYKLAAPGTLREMEQNAKLLETDLERWNVEVEALRSNFYELNYFTSRQLSLICQQLSSCAPNIALIQPWFKNLLVSICPSMVEELVLRAARDVVAEKDRTGEQKLLGLHLLEDKQEDEHCIVAGAEGTSGMSSLAEDELNETEKEIFDFLCKELEFLDTTVLQGLAQLGPDLDAVQRYCLQKGVLEATSAIAGDGSHLEVAAEKSYTVEPYTEHSLVSKLTDQEFSIELIKEAIEECGDDEDKVTRYCLENEKTFVPRSETVVDPSAISGGLM